MVASIDNLSKRKLKIRTKVEEELGISIEEIETLGYYDIMSHLDFPFFAIGGIKSTENVLEMSHISKGQQVLLIGCGQGNTAIHIAKNYGCKVVGIDIAEYMIKKAKERLETESEDTQKLVNFELGDAYNLEFEDETFDMVVCEFVAQFLDLDKAFKEFSRILRSRGHIALNEMFKMDDIPDEKQELVEFTEEKFSEAIGLDFKLNPPSVWKRWLKDASFSEIEIEEHSDHVKLSDGVKQIGGFRKICKLIGTMIRLLRASPVVRDRLMTMSKGKRYLMRKKFAGKYVGYVLISATKS